jgi:hypothetical protein
MVSERSIFDRFARWIERQLGRSATFALAFFQYRLVGRERPIFWLVGYLAARHQYGHDNREVSDGFRDPEHAKQGHSGAPPEARRADPGKHRGAKFADGAGREVGIGGRES